MYFGLDRCEKKKTCQEPVLSDKSFERNPTGMNFKWKKCSRGKCFIEIKSYDSLLKGCDFSQFNSHPVADSNSDIF